jgi:3',5'-cyclic AMP phosphodiesterase CpdA
LRARTSAPNSRALASTSTTKPIPRFSGDLTQHARQLEFEAASAFIAALPAPVVAVPGNHDIPARALIERMFDPRRRWRRFISQTTEPVVMLPGLALIGLDTVRRAQPHLDWSAGGVSAARLARLAARIEAAAGRRVVVVAHHPLRHPPAAVGRARPLGATATLAVMGRSSVRAVPRPICIVRRCSPAARPS